MRFAKAQEKKMGKPEAPVVVKPRGPQKSPISKGWIGTFLPYYTTQSDPNHTNPIRERNWRGTGEERRGKDVLLTLLCTVLLAFMLCGGLLFEVLRMFF
jgi:hypothetical protein